MSQSVLIHIARQSIQEVFLAEHSIDREALFDQHPLLKEPMATEIVLYLDDQIRGRSRSESPQRPLLDDIIHNAKSAAFEDEAFDPLTTSEYLRCRVELTLFRPEGVLTHRDNPILSPAGAGH